MPARLAMVGLLLVTGLGSSPAQSAAAPRVADLAWLAGRWQGTLANGATFETYYTDATGNTIVSVSKEHHAGRTLGFELELFFEKGGKVFYQPHPNGRKSEHVFPLLSYEPTARRATFENREHDFPQTFIFELTAPDTLVITLRGPGKDGTTKDIRYDLTRAK